jgi:prevent-host-death family protein
MALTASKLRQDIYRILDRVLETGRPVEVLRRGRVLKIVPEDKRSKLDSLAKHDFINGDPEGIVHIDWSGEWRP